MTGGICLTFDDCHLDSWVEAVPLLTLNRACATFFVSYFPQAVDADGLSKLQFLAAAGHEIGCHSVHHFHPEKFLAVFTAEEYVRTEVMPALKAMRACDLPCRAWCYPFNAYAPALSQRLDAHFDVQRARADAPGEALAAPGDRLLRGRSIDTFVAGQPGRVNDIAPALALLDAAAAQGRIAVLYGHDIAPAATRGHATAPQALLAVLQRARALGLRFLTASEVAHA